MAKLQALYLMDIHESDIEALISLFASKQITVLVKMFNYSFKDVDSHGLRNHKRHKNLKMHKYVTEISVLKIKLKMSLIFVN